MGKIYILEGDFPKGKKGHELTKKAAISFSLEEEMDLEDRIISDDIVLGEKGKPEFVSTPIHFSLSHSGSLWMCMVSNNRCGLDLQIVKDCNYKGISERYYSEDEKRYVDLCGINGFFQIWVRKEAFGKYTGQGFFGEMPSMVSPSNDILENVYFQGKKYYFNIVEISNDIKCVACTLEKEDIEIRLL